MVKHDPTFNYSILNAIYRIIELLGGDSGILGTVGSWKDTWDDETVLSTLIDVRKYVEERSGKAITNTSTPQMSKVDRIQFEIARIVELMGGSKEVVEAIRGWGHTLSDARILEILGKWEKEEIARQEIKPKQQHKKYWLN
jgi:hypothetical protein